MTDTTITIELVHGKYWLCQRGVYERSSVLAGQDFRQLNKAYDTLEEAQTDNPGVKFSDEGRPEIFIPTHAPSWFDPADAGEAWGEEDY